MASSIPAQLSFTKGHGTESDFVLLLDERGELDLSPELVQYLSDRHAGVGGDGVIRAVRAGSLSAGADMDPDAWFMDYWNDDGSVAKMCGNGARVFAAFLEHAAGVDLTEGLVIGTRGGAHTLTALENGNYTVAFDAIRTGDATNGADAEVEADGMSAASAARLVDVCGPHYVSALQSTEELEALDLTELPRITPTSADDPNVEVVVTESGHTQDGVKRGRARMRVHEYGSGETRSCGTGAVAVAVAVREWVGAGAPDVWDIEVSGGLLTVAIDGASATLEGPAVLVADGVVNVAPVKELTLS